MKHIVIGDNVIGDNVIGDKARCRWNRQLARKEEAKKRREEEKGKHDTKMLDDESNRVAREDEGINRLTCLMK